MTENVKQQSFALANILSKHGINISHSAALDVLAQLNCAKDWNVFSAKGNGSKVRTPMDADLLRQLQEQHIAIHGPLKDGQTVRLGCAADREGQLRLMEVLVSDRPFAAIGTMVRLGLERKFDKEGPAWERFIFVTFKGQAGAYLVSQFASMSKAELHNQTFDITLKKLETNPGLGVCPLTGGLHTSTMAVYAFVAGSDSPLCEGIVPNRVWDVSQMIVWDTPENPSRYSDGTQVTVTVGEVVDSFKRHRSARSSSV